MDDFGLVELAEVLRERIEQDVRLLNKVHSYISHELVRQPLSDLDQLVHIEEIEETTHGKVTASQARWHARNRTENGMASAFTKIGRKLFVNVPVYLHLLKRGGAP
jgi:hypothetical protein